MTKRHLGLDYGTRRVGVAVSDPLNIIARALTVIPNTPDLIRQIKLLVEGWNIGAIVVGMPLNLKGEKGRKAVEVERFIENLSLEVDVEVIRSDERFTSRLAEQSLRDVGLPRKKRQSKERVDEVAAALILQGYLDRLAR